MNNKCLIVTFPKVLTTKHLKSLFLLKKHNRDLYFIYMGLEYNILSHLFPEYTVISKNEVFLIENKYSDIVYMNLEEHSVWNKNIKLDSNISLSEYFDIFNKIPHKKIKEFFMCFTDLGDLMINSILNSYSSKDAKNILSFEICSALFGMEAVSDLFQLYKIISKHEKQGIKRIRITEKKLPDLISIINHINPDLNDDKIIRMCLSNQIKINNDFRIHPIVTLDDFFNKKCLIEIKKEKFLLSLIYNRSKSI